MLSGTIVASNYLAMAQVLARSYLRAHPDGRFVILVVDDGAADVQDDRVEILRLADLDVPDDELFVMLTCYDVREFSTSVKPAFLRALLEHDDVACYVDPDIYVYAPFDDVAERARETGIVLTPHVVEPMPRDGCDVDEQTLLLAGIFNLGFVAVGRSAEPFLRWWHDRLVTDAIVDLPAGYHTDQRWIDFVPSLFDFERCSDPTLNIAYWNAHERAVEITDGGPVIGSDPVRFVHFSGYDPLRRDVLSHWPRHPRYDFSPGQPLRTLADAYADELVDAGHLERRQGVYPHDTAPDGTPLTSALRRMWRECFVAELHEGHTSVSTPPAFGPRHVEFGTWLDAIGGGTPADPHARRERLVWLSRPDLRLAFPDVDGADAAGFRRWLDHDPDARRELGDYRPSWTDIRPLPDDRSTLRRVAGRAKHFARVVAKRAVALTDRLPDRHQAVDSGPRRLAFLHVPKSAGTSLAQQLRTALPEHRWAPWVLDPDQFGPYRDRELSPELRSIVLPDPGALRSVDAASGHFSLPSLLAAFRPADVVTVLREPRSRLLSHHRYWRNLSDAQIEAHDTWADINATASELDFGDWLADRRVAYQTDNVLARMLVPHHPAIPLDGFIADAAVPELVTAAIDQLAQLGWVDVVERGDAVFADVGRHVGAMLSPVHRNVTVERSSQAGSPAEFFEADAVERLRARTAVDRALWRWAAERRGVVDADGLADVVWARRLGQALG